MPKVRVPAAAGDEIVVNYGGDPIVTYKPGDDHTVTVKEEHLSAFLLAVDGSKVEGNQSSTKKEA